MKKIIIQILIVIIVCVGCAPKKTFRKKYEMKELETLDTNSWHLTNSIPLTPDKAVISAISYLELKYPKSENFSVDKIEILQWGEHWYYQIAFFKKRNDGAIVNQECVYVLLSGKVWQPKVEIENN